MFKLGKEFLQTVNGICSSHVNIYVDAKFYISFFIKEKQMKTIATLIAGLFAVTAFAAEPAKAPVAAPAAPAAAPAADLKLPAKKDDKKSEAAPAAKADAKAAAPAAPAAAK
jgi:hypothetical protein